MGDKSIPVTYNGKTVGYTDTDMRVIQWNKDDGEDDGLKELLKNQKIYVSSRRIGAVDEFGAVGDITAIEISLNKYEVGGKINATFYKKPKGKKEDIEINAIYKDDADFINRNGIKVSMEEDITGAILYFDYGATDNEGEPIEHIEISGSRSCEDTIKSATTKLKNILSK